MRRGQRVRAAAAVAALALATALPGCQSTAAPGPPVLAERSAVHCPLREPLAARGLVPIDSAAQWQGLMAGTETEHLGAPVAWAAQRVLVLGLGPQPTGGHRLEWVPPLRVDGRGTLAVPARHRPPAPDAGVTQAFTAPCLLLVLPRQGWHRAEIDWLR
jgi:hypothetical protein